MTTKEKMEISWRAWLVCLIVWLFVAILLYLPFCLSGCGSPMLTGIGIGAAGGAAGTHAFSKTVEGAQADLERKETELIDAYNKGVQLGAKKETLAEIEKEIEQVQWAKKGLEEGNKILGVDWNNPEDIGTKLGGVAALIVAYLSRKQLKTTGKKFAAHKRGEEIFRSLVPAETALKLYNLVGEERAKAL